jgi:hypothetical protein
MAAVAVRVHLTLNGVDEVIPNVADTHSLLNALSVYFGQPRSKLQFVDAATGQDINGGTKLPQDYSYDHRWHISVVPRGLCL